MLEALTGASPDMIENPKHALLGMLDYRVSSWPGTGELVVDNAQELYSDTLSVLMLYRHW